MELHCGNLYYKPTILGQNGVMVNTSRFLSFFAIWDIPPYTIEAEYVGKDIFQLQAQSPGFSLNAVLCEQGDPFILFLLFDIV